MCVTCVLLSLVVDVGVPPASTCVRRAGEKVVRNSPGRSFARVRFGVGENGCAVDHDSGENGGGGRILASKVPFEVLPSISCCLLCAAASQPASQPASQG